MGLHGGKNLTNISQQPCDVITLVTAILQMRKLRLREIQLHARGQGTILHARCQGTIKWRDLDLNPGLLTLKLTLGFCFLVVFYLLKLIFFSQRKLLIATINKSPSWAKVKINAMKTK